MTLGIRISRRSGRRGRRHPAGRRRPHPHRRHPQPAPAGGRDQVAAPDRHRKLWLAAAAGALLLGLSAVGSIGSGLSGGASSPPLSAREIEARLAVAAPAAPRAPVSPRPATPVVLPAGPAGTMLADCVDGRPSVVSVNPAQGFEAGEDDGGRTVTLESDDVDVTLALRCDGTRPAGTVTVEAED